MHKKNIIPALVVILVLAVLSNAAAQPNIPRQKIPASLSIDVRQAMESL
jgi:hypothetical protein